MKRTGKKTAHPGVRRVGKNSFHVRVLAKCPRTGKRFEKERRVADVSLREALDVQHELKLELEASIADAANSGGVVPVSRRGRLAEDMTFVDYAKIWFVHIEKSGRKRPHVVDNDINRVETLILPLLGHLYIGDIGKPELSSWMERLSDLKKANGKPYARETLASAWRLLSTMLRDCELLIGVKNTAPDHMRFRVKSNVVGARDVLTRDELWALLKATDTESPDIRAMIWLAATTGMRFGELSALTWDDVDFDNRLIHVTRSQVDGNVFPTKTKTNRTVPLFDVMESVLVEHRRWLAKQRFRREDGLIFPSRTGGYRDSSVTRGPLLRCAKKAGLTKRVTNQCLRRTANNLIRQSAGEIAARAITGHATQAMTEHYSDVTIAEKLEAGNVAFGLEERHAS